MKIERLIEIIQGLLVFTHFNIYFAEFIQDKSFTISVVSLTPELKRRTEAVQRFLVFAEPPRDRSLFLISDSLAPPVARSPPQSKRFLEFLDCFSRLFHLPEIIQPLSFLDHALSRDSA